VYIRPIA